MSSMRALSSLAARTSRGPLASLTSRQFSSSPKRLDQIPFTVNGQGTGVAQAIRVDGSGHPFQSDTYPAFGGKDSAPSPLHYALGSLSSCTQVTGSIVANEHGVVLNGWDVAVTGQFDPSVLVAGEKDNGNGGNWNAVHLGVTVKTDADDKKFDQWVSEVERRCPVTQLFKKSGVKWTSEWKKA